MEQISIKIGNEQLDFTIDESRGTTKQRLNNFLQNELLKMVLPSSVLAGSTNYNDSQQLSTVKRLYKYK